jgi:Ca2+-binding RTX toxin-like protein
VVDLAGSVLASVRTGEGTSLEWSGDGRSLVYSGYGVYRVDLAGGTRSRISSFGFDAALSPDGSQIAFAGAGECKDRHGIYRVTRDGRPVRITNDCRVFGTGRSDVLTGTAFFDILIGLEGDDLLVAVDPNLGGDDLYGGAGADRLLGAGGRNVLLDPFDRVARDCEGVSRRPVGGR